VLYIVLLVDLFPWSRFILIVWLVVGILSSFISVRTASGKESSRLLVGSYLVEICFVFP
jgi:hypothetical protein